MNEVKPAERYAIDWWKGRHSQGYFPMMDQHFNWRIYEAMEPWFLEMAAPQVDDDALEIGSGYGQWMAPLSRLVHSVRGFDIHPSLVDKSHEALAALPNASMILGDGLSIPYADDSFSLVYSISVFQHMPRAIVQRYLEETVRVMTGEGRALFHFRHADNDGPYSEDIRENHDGDWSVGWTEEEVRDALVAVGLTAKRIIKGQSLIVLAELG